MDTVKRVLIVDDEPDLLKTVAFRIKKAGYEVLTADNGKDGFEKARGERPDLIVLDWKLPIMDGQEVFRALKADPDLKAIPVIFLTASRESETVIQDLGAKDIIIKPYKAEELLARIAELIKR